MYHPSTSHIAQGEATNLTVLSRRMWATCKAWCLQILCS